MASSPCTRLGRGPVLVRGWGPLVAEYQLPAQGDHLLALAVLCRLAPGLRAQPWPGSAVACFPQQMRCSHVPFLADCCDGCDVQARVWRCGASWRQ